MKHPISISRDKGSVVVTVRGPVDPELLERTLADLGDDQGNLSLIIDLRDAPSLDARGIDVLVEASGQFQERGGELVVDGPPVSLQHALHERGVKILLP